MNVKTLRSGDAIHHKADLVNVTNKLFEQIKDEERRRVVTLAEAQRRIITATSNEDLNFFLEILQITQPFRSFRPRSGYHSVLP